MCFGSIKTPKPQAPVAPQIIPAAKKTADSVKEPTEIRDRTKRLRKGRDSLVVSRNQAPVVNVPTIPTVNI